MERIDEILSTMDVPDSRKHDWAWLLRNLWIRNAAHKDISEAYEIVKNKYKEWIRPKPRKI